MSYNNQKWYTEEADYPAFRLNFTEQQSSSFDSMCAMDKLLVVMEKIFLPIGNLIPKLSDSAARHREINASYQRDQGLFSMVQQQQKQIQELMQNQQTEQHFPSSPVVVQQPTYAQPQMYLPPMETYQQQMLYPQMLMYIQPPVYPSEQQQFLPMEYTQTHVDPQIKWTPNP